LLLASGAYGRAASTRAGIVVSVDVAARSVVLRHGATETTYSVPEKAVLMAGKKPCGLDAFQKGASVMVRFRVAPNGPQVVYDLTDADTWPWLVRARRETLNGVIKEVTERGIIVEAARDGGVMVYRVTDKTRISLDGATSLADLKPGTPVAVAPRLLPNGETMASIIADSVPTASRLRERTMPTVTGTIRSVDTARRMLEMDTRAGDRRTLHIGDPCVVRREGRDVPLGQLRVGQWITAHVRQVGDQDYVHRITIQKRPAPAGSRKPKPRRQA
jgi:hypothetical protein